VPRVVFSAWQAAVTLAAGLFTCAQIWERVPFFVAIPIGLLIVSILADDISPPASFSPRGS